jgi:hypothetical protein
MKRDIKRLLMAARRERGKRDSIAENRGLSTPEENKKKIK